MGIRIGRQCNTVSLSLIFSHASLCALTSAGIAHVKGDLVYSNQLCRLPPVSSWAKAEPIQGASQPRRNPGMRQAEA